MQVTLQYATEHLDELASAADNGEDVEIARPEKPLLRLVTSATLPDGQAGDDDPLGALRRKVSAVRFDEWQRMDPVREVPERPRSELFGSLAGKIEMSSDWNSDQTNLEIERQFAGEAKLQDELPG
jgi:antitoxin (DNA-binding transcriptional repressor) of toxin-antitoxin stability system